MEDIGMSLAAAEALIDIEYVKDIDALAAEFSGVDRLDDASLRAWFVKHPYLTTHDMARIAGVTFETVYDWRIRVGWRPPVAIAPLRPKPVPPPPRPGVQCQAAPPPPPGWGIAWAKEQYEAGYSMPAICKATGKKYLWLYWKLRAAGCKFRSVAEAMRTKNRCCSLAWIFEHYCRRGMSAKACAKEAGVSRYVFTSWLHKFDIRMRSHAEQVAVWNAARMGRFTGPQAQGVGQDR